MKTISHILSLYMLVLSLVPCSDGIDYLHGDCSSDIEIVNDSHNHSDHDHEDLCTPFCICACCGSIATMPSSLDYLGFYIEISTVRLHHYESNYSYDYSKGIWHPPAVS